MSKRKLTPDEMKQIAHFISQRSTTSHTSGGEVIRATEHYLETYNKVMDKLEEYNSTN